MYFEIYVIIRHSLSCIIIHAHTHSPYTHTHTHTYIYKYAYGCTHTHTHTHTFPSLPRTHTLSTPAFSWYLPAKQLMQVLATVAPTVVEYLPAVQSVQTVEAVPAAYFPAVQSVQTVEPVVRAQRQITSQIHMHMYVCIEDVCMYPYSCMYVSYV